ncbi:MAG: histidine kinase [Capnocytophaga sp.]|nr:histidine kinase [Capnocytophaga sp.]
MKKILLVTIMFSFFSCDKNSDTVRAGIGSTTDFKNDSVTISRMFDRSLDDAKWDSISASAEKAFEHHPKSYFFYKLHYGRALVLRGQLQKADSVLDAALRSDALLPKSIEAARLYNLKGAVYAYRQHQKEAVTYYQKALEIFEEENDVKAAAMVEFNLANIFLSQLDHESSHKYSGQASEKLRAVRDTLYLPLSLAISSISSAILGDIEQAVLLVEESSALSEKHQNGTGKLLSHFASGEIAMRKEDYAAATAYFLETIRMSEQSHQKSILLPAKAALLKAYLMQEKYTTAIQWGEDAKDMAAALGNREIQYNLYKNLAFSYEKIKNTDFAFAYMKKAEELLREKSSVENQENVQKLLIRYETERKERQIAEQELKIQKKNVQMQNWLIVGVLIFGSFLVFVFQMRYRQRNKLKIMEKEKENEVLSARILGEEIERSRISKELHDGIASNLVAVKLQIESNTEISQKIISLVRDTHKEVRQIAHNLMPIDFDKQNIIHVIKAFCEECSTESRPVNFQTNSDKINLNNDRSMVLYRSVQEFIQNAIKHSEATQIEVLLMENEGIVSINIEDNGTGFDTGLKETSKGLSGAILRIEKIKGRVNIDSSGRGTSVFISIKPD